jgi:hypothetical protein
MTDSAEIALTTATNYRQQTIGIANIRFVPQLKSAKTLVLTLTTFSGESVIADINAA